MKIFDLVQMANGGHALVLEPTSTWEEFPAFAQAWTSRLKARSISKPVITFDICMAEIEVMGGRFWITYDDFQSSIQLEPKEPTFNHIVAILRQQLVDAEL